ncbi:MAG: arsenical pump rane protein, partial [Acidimicrobiaceae bacterium]|nr:arsenical pump rane protein [Acidimicrobiaceae bacterium]
ASRTWPPFVLVAVLLLIGWVANEEGAFDRVAGAAARVRGGAAALLVVLLALAAVVTAVLNLDTSVAFLTPVLVLAARRRGVPEEPFLLGSLLMANAASLLLPGSNLTNLLVLGQEHISGAAFAARMFPAWLAAIAVTAAVVLLRLRTVAAPPKSPDPPRPIAGGWLGTAAAALAALAIIVLPSAALPVLAVGLAAVAVRVLQRRLPIAELGATVDAAALVGLFGLAAALGTLAGTWSGPGRLMSHATAWESAAIGALGAVILNNLPAAALFSAHGAAHPRALLIGLDLGPNLAVTGSLSALLWFRAARSVDARPSVMTVSKIGVVLVPVSIAAALLALRVLANSHA